MSRMADIDLSIREFLFSGDYSNREIADMLNIPIEWVNAVEEDMGFSDDYYDDSMDGDHESALASVGWGVDEDYVADNDFFDDF